jgi:hypothetical protein
MNAKELRELTNEQEARIRAENQRTTLLSQYHTRGLELERKDAEIANLKSIIAGLARHP